MKSLVYNILIGLISFIIGILFVITGFEAYNEYVREQGYNSTASGKVTKKYFQRASDGNSFYYVDYSFSLPAGRKINATGNILKENWDNLKEDDPIEIKYDQTNPNRNIPLYGGSTSLAYVFFVIIFGTVFLVFGFMRFVTEFRKSLKNRA